MKKLSSFLLILINLYPLLYAQQGTVKTYYGSSDTLKSEINFSNNVREGQAKFFYPDGKLKQELTYVNGKVEGLVKEYGENGKMKEMFNVESGKREGPTSLFDKNGDYLKDINYSNGKLMPEEKPVEAPVIAKGGSAKKEDAKNISTQKIANLKQRAAGTPVPPSYKEENDKIDPAYFLTAEIMPEPVGGMAAIMKKLVYPEYAKDNNIQGTVEVKAFIDSYGEVTNAEIVKGIGYGCDEAAKIAVFYAQFKPGIIKGKPVNVQMVIPVVFKLGEN